MALEATDRLIDIIWVNWRCTCGCILRPPFKVSASLIDIMGKSKEICKEIKRNVDLHKSGSSLGEISKRLKVPHSSVQTIVRKYKHNGTTQPSYHSGRRHILSPRYELTKSAKIWCENCKSFPEQQQRSSQRSLCKDAGGNRYKSSISTVKQVLYQHNLKGRSAHAEDEWAKIHATYCGKLVEGYPKRLTQVKQFKDNATKY